jgi:hypothetical protein
MIPPLCSNSQSNVRQSRNKKTLENITPILVIKYVCPHTLLEPKKSTCSMISFLICTYGSIFPGQEFGDPTFQLTLRSKISKWHKVENSNQQERIKEHVMAKRRIFPSDSDFDLNFLPCAFVHFSSHSELRNPG